MKDICNIVLLKITIRNLKTLAFQRKIPIKKSLSIIDIYFHILNLKSRNFIFIYE